MPYLPLDVAKPNIAQTRDANLASARINLQAVRDILMTTGIMPGWQMHIVSGGAIPGPNPEKPESIYYAMPPEYVRVDFNWSAAGNVTVMVFYYTPDAGATYFPLTDTAGNYIVRITYDANEVVTSIVWGAALADEEAVAAIDLGALQ